MNDSFLEDLELVPEPKQSSRPVDRHVTTRTATSSPLQHLDTKLDSFVQKSERGSPTVPEPKQAKDPLSRKSPDKDSRKQCVRIKVPERKERSVETKLRPVENRVRTEPKEEQKLPKVPERQKAESRSFEKERTRRSVNQKDSTQSSDLSSKENRPSNSPRGSKSPLEVSKDRGKKCDCSRRSSSKEKDPVVLLSAIKELISTYTRQESTKILRAMQELHLNSQANLIKNFIAQTDDLIKEMHPSKESMRVRALVDQNQRLQEDVTVLQKRNDELWKRMEELELLKEENISLKLKCKELSKHSQDLCSVQADRTKTLC